MEPSIARGLAWAAVLAVVVVLARAAVTELSIDATGEVESSCAVPVELVTDRGVRLGCADEAELSACAGLRPGDRVSGDCEVEPGAMSARARLVVGVPIDLNRASRADLELLDGIGPKLAEAIVDERARAPFERVDDLVRVRGIGPVKLEAVRRFVAVRSE